MAEYKFYCPQCGQHILCDTSHSGMQINCPVCQKPIIVPQAPAAAPVPPQPAPVYSLHQSTPPPTGHQYMGSPIAKPAVLAQSNVARNLLIILASLIIMTLIGVGCWFGYSRIIIHGQREPLPAGLVALWSGEGNGKDSVAGHDADLSGGVTYAPGKIGSGFKVDGHTGMISVAASPALDVGTGPGLTLAGWIAPESATEQEPLMEWRGSRGINQGLQFWISVNFAGVGGPGCLYANMVNADGGSHVFASPVGIIQPGVFQFVALTYDKTGGVAKMYCNGALVATVNLGSFTPKTDTALLLGNRADSGEFHYQGVLDEISLYNRALSAGEIQAIYTAQK